MLHPTERCFKKQRKYKDHKKSPFSPRNSNNKRTEHNGLKPNMFFRCGLEDSFIVKFPKLDTSEKKLFWCTKNHKTRAYILTKIYKTSYNSKYKSESQEINVCMEHISYNAETPRRYFGDSLQITNWILDSGATCHMIP